jgi:hypothetical protein
LAKFFLTLAATSGIIIGIAAWAVDQAYLEHLPTFFYQSIFFLAFSTAIIYRYLYRVDKPDFFVQLYLLMMTVKLLAYACYVYFMIVTDTSGASANVAFFLAVYFLFTGLEVAFLFHKINR